MRNDLLEAQASIDWPRSQLVPLQGRLDEWLKTSVQIEIRDLTPPTEYNCIVAVEKELLPIAFSVEVGAYINAIRSSLDILAMVLVRRYEINIKEHEVSFPVFNSEQDFQKHNGGRFLQHLPNKEREIIASLKPYRDGDAALWSLHHLDIVRKHRRLLDVGIRPIDMALAGTFRPGDFEPLATGIIQINDETVLGLIRKGVPEPAIRSRFYVGMKETGYLDGNPILETISHLGDVASRVVARFDY
jgi:hypothetical protein